MPLEDGQALKLTTFALLHAVRRYRSHQRGIEPDLLLPEPPATAVGHEPTGEQDPEIREAVAFLEDGPHDTRDGTRPWERG
jgi:C-terminal processing protease CtpA/Prc